MSYWTADCTSVVYDRKIWRFGRIFDSGTRFIAISGCLSSEVTPVEVVNTVYMSLTQNNNPHSTFTYRNIGNS